MTPITDEEHREVEKYRREGCPLYNKLALVAGNSIATGTTSQICVDLGDDLLREPERALMDELEDVDVGKDTPSPFLSRNKSPSEQSRRGNSSPSTRHRKRTEMSTDDTSKFIDAMKDIFEAFRDVIKSKDVNTNSDWYEALLKISDLPIELKYRMLEWLEMPNKKVMFMKMIVEDQLEWLKFCYR
ncbi:uncharacterized protein [Aristolochia californica]|uniref:uncharacterized protein n=1 Tax=Aristolochia californica TaxID=171875 RepID=UPI0035E2E262